MGKATVIAGDSDTGAVVGGLIRTGDCWNEVGIKVGVNLKAFSIGLISNGPLEGDGDLVEDCDGRANGKLIDQTKEGDRDTEMDGNRDDTNEVDLVGTGGDDGMALNGGLEGNHVGLVDGTRLDDGALDGGLVENRDGRDDAVVGTDDDGVALNGDLEGNRVGLVDGTLDRGGFGGDLGVSVSR